MAVDLNNPQVAEILAQIRAIDWYQFEKLVALLFEDADYKVERRGGAKADGGVDLIVEKSDYAGVIQCKHWNKTKVPPKEIRELNTVRQNEGVQHAVCVTMRGFTAPAQEEAAKYGIQLYSEAEIVDFINKAEGVCAPRISELLNDPAKYCPKCDSEMVVRTTKNGPNAGATFWGCSAYPKCKGVTFPISAETKSAVQPTTAAELEAKREKTEKLVRYIMENW